ncbi:MAG: pyridoxamine 5'-phosphate oxidase family protein [Chloroflexota bacterium]
MPLIPEQITQRLATARNIWLATVRPNGAPHLIPIWFVAHDERIYICTDPASVKIRNLRQNDRTALALEDGSSPVILEGTARIITNADTPTDVVTLFKTKYDWDILADAQYSVVVVVAPTKQLGW